MTLDYGRGKAPLITVFGGDVTTSRLRAERAVSRLTPFYPMSARWTAKAPLPGGDFAWDRFDNEVDEARERWRFLDEDQARRLVAAYGSNVKAILREARVRGDLGPALALAGAALAADVEVALFFMADAVAALPALRTLPCPACSRPCCCS